MLISIPGDIYSQNATSPAPGFLFWSVFEILSRSIPDSTGQALLGCVLHTAVGSAVLGFPKNSKSGKQLWWNKDLKEDFCVLTAGLSCPAWGRGMRWDEMEWDAL